jgi:hypothetical protein
MDLALNTRDNCGGTLDAEMGRRGPAAWRERPHLWPRAWQTDGSFGVVAHATRPLLAPAPAVAHQAGRHGTPPDDDSLQPARGQRLTPCSRVEELARG